MDTADWVGRAIDFVVWMWLIALTYWLGIKTYALNEIRNEVYELRSNLLGIADVVKVLHKQEQEKQEDVD